MNIIERLFKTTGNHHIAIYVPTPKVSIQLQNYLFTLGYRWIDGKIPSYTGSNCIHVCKDNSLLTYSHIRNVSTDATAIMYYKIVPNLKKLC